jgi:hypothetical protein
MTNRRFTWNDRLVVFVDYNIKKGREVRKVFAADPELGMHACLVASMRYADTSEPVFQSVDEIDELPNRLQERVILLAAQAARVNAVIKDDEPDDEDAKPNGHDAEGAHPSL